MDIDSTVTSRFSSIVKSTSNTAINTLINTEALQMPKAARRTKSSLPDKIAAAGGKRRH